jgi:hypothetical protein
LAPNLDAELIAMDQIRVLLVGGPNGTDRVLEVSDTAQSIKLARAGGYDHFRYSGQSQDLHGSELPVFEWCDRTKVAE